MGRALRVLLVGALLAGGRIGAFAASLTPGHFEYTLAWNGIPAGSATVDVAAGDAARVPAVHVDATARTNSVVDLLWRFRGYAGASFAQGSLEPLGFQWARDVNREQSLTEVRFTGAPHGAAGTLYRKGRIKTMAVDEPGTLDPVTAIFQALASPLQVGERLSYGIFTGESRYRVELVIAGVETVRVAAGRYPAWRVIPRVWKVGKGLDERLRGATVWVSQTPVRAVLRVRSEVFIGAVTGDLQRMVVATTLPGQVP